MMRTGVSAQSGSDYTAIVGQTVNFAAEDFGASDTAIGVAGAVVIWRLALALRAGFLFERPEAFWIAPKKAEPRLQAAE